MAAIGPLTVYLPADNALIKQSWRTHGNVILCIPIIMGVYHSRGGYDTFWEDFSFPVLMESALGALFGFAWATSLVVGCSMTITAHALVMYTCTGVYMLLFSLLTCVEVHV